VQKASPRRWYSPEPGPVIEPITPRRAYAEVLLVFSAFFLASVVAAAFLLAGRSEDTLKNASWSVYIPATLDLVSSMGLAVAVVWLLCERRGVHWPDLASLPRRARGGVDTNAVVRIAAWAFGALVVGGLINVALQTGHLPTEKTNAPELIFAFFESLNAGIVEELVVLAFVVVSLRQARRPLWEITVVALALRGSYHIYYGPGVLGVVVWAGLFLWLYLRTRALLVLMVCHTLWDLASFFSERWQAVATVGVLLLAVLFIAAPITWLVDRSKPGGGGWEGPAWTDGGPPGWSQAQGEAGPGRGVPPPPAGVQFHPRAGPHRPEDAVAQGGDGVLGSEEE
jgi:Type II CAAX prenyl endopeptidase Rce1-like